MREKNELRQNIVSGNWILISPTRGRRPHEFKETGKRKRHPKSSCPFDKPEKGLTFLSYPTNEDPRIRVRLNKYPAVTHSEKKADAGYRGPFPVMDAHGHHEVVITEDHDKNYPELPSEDALLLFQLFQKRYEALSEDRNTAYVSIFHNWGEKAGASIYHPHYQIISVPVVPSSVGHSLQGSRKYFKKNKKCVHCVQLAWEKKEKKRIICENKYAIALAPFASKEPFEMRVFPKEHLPFFEETFEERLKHVAEILQTVLQKLEKALSEPDYNFFIHTAPVADRNRYSHYHWHIEILPRTNISAGFELGTDVEINPLKPEKAAAFLRKAK